MNYLLRPRNWEPACRRCRLRCGTERSAASANNMAVLLSEPEAWCPRVLGPATYHSGKPRLRFWILDFGFLTAIDDIELGISDFAIGSRVLTSFSANFQSAFRNLHSAIVDPLARPPRLARMAGRPVHLHGLPTTIHEI
jgi:hypothetical protein